MPFQKGQSGNPAGRPRGSRNKAAMALQDLLEHDAESIARTVTHLAKDGNIAAIRMCMERLLPPRRHEPVTCDLPALDTAADAVAAVSAIVAAVASGDLTASEAADLAKVVDLHLLALGSAAFEERLARLENGPAQEGDGVEWTQVQAPDANRSLPTGPGRARVTACLASGEGAHRVRGNDQSGTDGRRSGT
jgi:hypothetical protein